MWRRNVRDTLVESWSDEYDDGTYYKEKEEAYGNHLKR